MYIDSKLNAGNYTFINFFKNPIYIYSNNIIKLLNLNRIKLLATLFLNLLKKKGNDKNFTHNQFLFKSLNDLYFQLINAKKDYTLICLFLFKYKFKYIFFNKNFLNLKNFLYTKLLYRQYNFLESSEYNYYDD